MNLEGFAKMFFESANEERQHGLKFLEYLKLRGDEEIDIGIDALAPILGKDTYVFFLAVAKLLELFNLLNTAAGKCIFLFGNGAEKLININNLCQSNITNNALSS